MLMDRPVFRLHVRGLAILSNILRSIGQNYPRSLHDRKQSRRDVHALSDQYRGTSRSRSPSRPKRLQSWAAGRELSIIFPIRSDRHKMYF